MKAIPRTGIRVSCVTFAISVLLLMCSRLVFSHGEAAKAAITIDAAGLYQQIDGFGSSFSGFAAFERGHFDQTIPLGVTYKMAPELRETLVRVAIKDLGVSHLRMWLGRGVEEKNDNDDPHSMNWPAFRWEGDSRLPQSENFRENRFNGIAGWPDFLRQARALGLEYWIPTPGGSMPEWLQEMFRTNHPNRFEEYAEWAAAHLLYLKRAGFEAPYWSMFNEPDVSSRGWKSADLWIPWIKATGRRFRKEGLGTKIMFPDSAGVFDGVEMVKGVMKDEEVRSYIGSLAYHHYRSSGRGPQPFLTLAATPEQEGSLFEKVTSGIRAMAELGRQFGVPSWQTETAYYPDFTKKLSEWEVGMGRANEVHYELIFGASALEAMSLGGGPALIGHLTDGKTTEEQMLTRRSMLTLLGTAGAGLASPVTAYSRQLADARSAGTSKVPKLRITKVRAVELSMAVTSSGRVDDARLKFVRVYTDQGLTGTGEMTGGATGSAWLINEHLGPAIVGRDPLDIEAIYSHFWGWGEIPGSIKGVFVRGMGGPFLSAVSGIEIALWDLAGKAMGVPLYRLFGGKVREKIPIYFWWRSDDEVKRTIKEKRARAFKMGIYRVTESGDPNARLDPGQQRYWGLTHRQLDAIVERADSARKLIGPDVELAFDCHSRYDAESAIQIGRAVAPARPIWLEDPVPEDNIDALVLVRRSVPVPVAFGENTYTRYGFREVVEKQAASVLQPDMTKCGGLLETKKIAAMAETYHIRIAPHGTATPLGQMAYAHVCATIPNFLILEWGFLFQDEWNSFMRNVPTYENGFVSLAEAPGIGIEVNDDAIREKVRPGFTWS